MFPVIVSVRQFLRSRSVNIQGELIKQWFGKFANMTQSLTTVNNDNVNVLVI
jgi:hypothetical protein